MSSRTVDGVELAIVGPILDVDLCSDVTLIGFAVVFFFDSNAYALSGRRWWWWLVLLRSLLSVLFVGSDLNFFLSWSRGGTVSSFLLLVDANLLFSTVVLDLRAGSGEGGVAGFVTFPSDARSLIR